MNWRLALVRLGILGIFAACLVYVLANMETEDQASARLRAETERLSAETDQLERRLRAAGVEVPGDADQRDGGRGE